MRRRPVRIAVNSGAQRVQPLLDLLPVSAAPRLALCCFALPEFCRETEPHDRVDREGSRAQPALLPAPVVKRLKRRPLEASASRD